MAFQQSSYVLVHSFDPRKHENSTLKKLKVNFFPGAFNLRQSRKECVQIESKTKRMRKLPRSGVCGNQKHGMTAALRDRFRKTNVRVGAAQDSIR